MVQFKTITVALALAASSQAHFVGHGDSAHHLIARGLANTHANHDTKMLYHRGLLSGLTGVLGALTGSLDQGLDPQANIISTVVGSVTTTVQTLLNQIANLPRLNLPLALGNTTGYIVLSGPENGYLGLAPNSNNIAGSYGLVKDKASAALFTLPATSCLTLPYVFPIYGPLKGQAQGTPFLSAVSFTNSPANQLEPSTGGFGFLQGSNLTAVNTFGTGVSAYPGFAAESSIWTITCSSNVLVPYWTDKNGAVFPLTVVEYYQPNGFLEVTGNLTAYNKKYQIETTGYNPTGTAVKMVFQPQDENDLVTWSVL